MTLHIYLLLSTITILRPTICTYIQYGVVKLSQKQEIWRPSSHHTSSLLPARSVSSRVPPADACRISSNSFADSAFALNAASRVSSSSASKLARRLASAVAACCFDRSNYCGVHIIWSYTYNNSGRQKCRYCCQAVRSNRVRFFRVQKCQSRQNRTSRNE